MIPQLPDQDQDQDQDQETWVVEYPLLLRNRRLQVRILWGVLELPRLLGAVSEKLRVRDVFDSLALFRTGGREHIHHSENTRPIDVFKVLPQPGVPRLGGRKVQEQRTEDESQQWTPTAFEQD